MYVTSVPRGLDGGIWHWLYICRAFAAAQILRRRWTATQTCPSQETGDWAGLLAPTGPHPQHPLPHGGLQLGHIGAVAVCVHEVQPDQPVALQEPLGVPHPRVVADGDRRPVLTVGDGDSKTSISFPCLYWRSNIHTCAYICTYIHIYTCTYMHTHIKYVSITIHNTNIYTNNT